MTERPPSVQRAADAPEFPTDERCHIREFSNSEADPALSIAHARVEPGVTTRWHCLDGTTERYVILAGQGEVEVGEQDPTPVGPGDVVLIPPGCRQRIRNRGATDLLFLAICTPRFTPTAYRDLE
jgi:mannose-6-phosphate isomerase-like protein (cupin superfamily)